MFDMEILCKMSVRKNVEKTFAPLSYFKIKNNCVVLKRSMGERNPYTVQLCFP